MALTVCLCCTQTGSWVCLIGLLLFALLKGNELQSLRQAPLIVPILFYSLAVVLAGLFSEGAFSPDEGLKALLSLRGIVLSYLVAAQLFQNDLHSQPVGPKFVAPTLVCLLFCGAVSGMFGMVQQLFNFHPFTYPFLQATGFLNEPMSFAGLMQLTSFLGLGILIKGGFKDIPFCGNRLLFSVIVLANFLGLVFASERSAWLGMICGVLGLCFYVSPRRFVEGVMALAAVAVLSYFFVPVVHARIEPLFNPRSDVGVSARLTIWSKAWQIFQEHPITGIGPRKFPRIEMPDAIVPGHSTDLNHAHSNYLQVLSTTGLIGFATFAFLLLATIFRAWQQSRLANSLLSSIGLGLFAAMISLSVAGIFEYNFGSGQVKIAQWFLLGLLITPLTASRLSIDNARQLENPE